MDDLGHDIEALVLRQMENEKDIIDGGISRYREKVQKAQDKGRASETRAAVWLLKQLIEPVAKRLIKFTDDALQGKPGPKAIYAKVFDRLDPEVCAFIGIKVIQNAIAFHARKTRTSVAQQIGHAIKEELQFNHMKAEDSRTYKYWVRQVERASNRITKSRCLQRLKKNYAKIPTLDTKAVIACGTVLIQCILDSTTMLESYDEIDDDPKKKPTECLRLTASYRANIERLHTKAESMWPRYEPMLCPPKPWDGAFGCGFVGELGRRTKLVRTHNRAYLEDIHHSIHRMPKVLTALNAIQATPFRINKTILDILGAAIEARGGERYKLPGMNPLPTPFRPSDIKTNREAAKRFANDIKAIQRINDKNESKRFAVLLTRSLGEKYRDETAIWFAHNLDWRGRVYPLATCLSPQGDELARAVLEFARGLPLETDEAVEWLAIHGAGCWGNDKVSFAERVQWVRDNEENIRKTVEAPLDFLWWTEADKPWMFLAWCHEWVGYLTRGKEHVSHIAIAMDGSCNGLQNFAAMLRHEETARAVNLAPSETPNDIYQNVADKVKAMVDALAASDARPSEAILEEIERRTLVEFSDAEVSRESRLETAALWDVVTARWIQNHITRKLVKRPVMTYPYSVTKYGMRDQLVEALLDMHGEGKTGYPIEHAGKVADMLKSRVFDAIRDTVTAAARAMDWLKAAAKVVVKDKKPVSWVSPIGMLVLQDYRRQEGAHINTSVGGVRLRPRIKQTGTTLDTRKQSAGIAPNFVHSCDASHLMFTVNAFIAQGRSDVQMIHDSYGTHACNAAVLARILREQFVEMYGKQDVLAEFQAQLAQDVGSDLALQIPDSPALESFDLTQVLGSKYFFA